MQRLRYYLLVLFCATISFISHGQTLVTDSTQGVFAPAVDTAQFLSNPGTITYTQADIQALGAQRLVDLIRITPGFQVLASTEGPTLSIRGLGGEVPKVALIMDGKLLNDAFVGSMTLEGYPLYLAKSVTFSTAPSTGVGPLVQGYIIISTAEGSEAPDRPQQQLWLAGPPSQLRGGHYAGIFPLQGGTLQVSRRWGFRQQWALGGPRTDSVETDLWSISYRKGPFQVYYHDQTATVEKGRGGNPLFQTAQRSEAMQTISATYQVFQEEHRSLAVTLNGLWQQRRTDRDRFPGTLAQEAFRTRSEASSLPALAFAGSQDALDLGGLDGYYTEGLQRSATDEQRGDLIISHVRQYPKLAGAGWSFQTNVLAGSFLYRSAYTAKRQYRHQASPMGDSVYQTVGTEQYRDGFRYVGTVPFAITSLEAGRGRVWVQVGNGLLLSGFFVLNDTVQNGLRGVSQNVKNTAWPTQPYIQPWLKVRYRVHPSTALQFNYLHASTLNLVHGDSTFRGLNGFPGPFTLTRDLAQVTVQSIFSPRFTQMTQVYWQSNQTWGLADPLVSFASVFTSLSNDPLDGSGYLPAGYGHLTTAGVETTLRAELLSDDQREARQHRIQGMLQGGYLTTLAPSSLGTDSLGTPQAYPALRGMAGATFFWQHTNFGQPQRGSWHLHLRYEGQTWQPASPQLSEPRTYPAQVQLYTHLRYQWNIGSPWKKASDSGRHQVETRISASQWLTPNPILPGFGPTPQRVPRTQLRLQLVYAW